MIHSPRKNHNSFTASPHKSILSSILQGPGCLVLFLLECWGLKLCLNDSRRPDIPMEHAHESQGRDGDFRLWLKFSHTVLMDFL